MKVLAIVGRSGVGKTTLMEALVAELSQRGRRVGTLKHTHHPLEDRPGSDSARHRAAGALLSMLSGPGGFSQWGEEPDPTWLVEQARERGCELMLVEGLKSGPFLRLEVVRGAEPLLADPWAVASPWPRPGRWFDLNRPELLADAIEGL